MSLRGLSNVVKYFGVRAEPTQVKQISEAPTITPKHSTRLERLARDKDSSVLGTVLNYDRKKFYETFIKLFTAVSYEFS